MATTKNITMKQFNGTDYDTLYPKTLGSQITGAVPVASGGTGGTTAKAGMYNLLNGMSAIPLAKNDLFPFKDVSGSTSGLVSLTNLIRVMGESGVITTSNLSSEVANLGYSKIQTGSYVGTGTNGEDNPCSLTFSYAPKIVLFTDVVSISDGTVSASSLVSDPSNNFIIHSLDALTTTYVNSAGYGASTLYGRKSSDGKTIYWYNTTNAARQFNSANYRYYWVAIN